VSAQRLIRHPKIRRDGVSKTALFETKLKGWCGYLFAVLLLLMTTIPAADDRLQQEGLII
jgi:hypothetical protein